MVDDGRWMVVINNQNLSDIRFYPLQSSRLRQHNQHPIDQGHITLPSPHHAWKNQVESIPAELIFPDRKSDGYGP
jgi:hypothetical protein